MSVFRVEKTKNYTTMSNHHLRDKNLSLKAKGLLSQMLSLPENWDYTLKGLSVINKEKVDAIRSAVKELEQAGYLVRGRERDEKGQLGKTEYLIREVPLSIQQEQNSGNQEKKAMAPATEGSPCEVPEAPAEDLTSPSQTPDPAFSTQEDTLDKSSGIPDKTSDFLNYPMLDEPMLDFPILDNPTQINTEEQITDSQNKDYYSDSIPQTSPHMEAHRNPTPKENRAEEKEKKEYYSIWQRLKENISYEELKNDPGISTDELDQVMDVLFENLCTNRKTIRVAKSDWPASKVKDRLLSLKAEHIRFTFQCLHENATQIRNIRQYLLTSLYNSITSIRTHQQYKKQYERNRNAKVPMGCSCELGEAELEAIRRVMSDSHDPYIPFEDAG